MSKGSEQRPGDRQAFERNWEKIFGGEGDKKKKKKIIKQKQPHYVA